MASPGKPAPLSPSKLNNGNSRTGHSSPSKRGIPEQSSHDVLTARSEVAPYACSISLLPNADNKHRHLSPAQSNCPAAPRERFASEGQENQSDGGIRRNAASPLAHGQSDGAAEHTPEPQALDEEGRAYSPNSNPFGKRPATRTPAGSYIAARRRTSGNSDSGLPSVPDFQASPSVLTFPWHAEPADAVSHQCNLPTAAGQHTMFFCGCANARGASGMREQPPDPGNMHLTHCRCQSTCNDGSCISAGEVSSQGPATPASPQLRIHTGDVEAVRAIPSQLHVSSSVGGFMTHHEKAFPQSVSSVVRVGPGRCVRPAPLLTQ